MKLFLTFSLPFSILSTRAQDSIRKRDDHWTISNLEIVALYPGGHRAWEAFLNKNLRYPDDAVSNNIQGDVVVEFIVDTDSTTSDFQAISGPENGGLREEAIRLIKLCGPWQPMIRNGQKVKSNRQQSISFRLVTDSPQTPTAEETKIALLYSKTIKIT